MPQWMNIPYFASWYDARAAAFGPRRVGALRRGDPGQAECEHERHEWDECRRTGRGAATRSLLEGGAIACRRRYVMRPHWASTARTFTRREGARVPVPVGRRGGACGGMSSGSTAGPIAVRSLVASADHALRSASTSSGVSDRCDATSTATCRRVRDRGVDRLRRVSVACPEPGVGEHPTQGPIAPCDREREGAADIGVECGRRCESGTRERQRPVVGVVAAEGISAAPT